MRPLVHHEPWAAIAFYVTLGIWLAGELALQARTSTDSGDRTRAWMWAGSLAGLAAAFALAGDDPRLPGPGWVAVAAGLALMLAGIALRVWAIRTLGRFFTVTVDVADDHRVVDSGPYGLVRHPSYTGMLVSFVGVGAALDSWLGTVAAPALLLLGVVARIRHEERTLRDELPGYPAYAGRTKRLVPFVW